MANTRICPGCGEEKDCEADFYTHNASGRKDKKRTRCKKCVLRDNRATVRDPNWKPRRDFTCQGCGSDFRRESQHGSRKLCDSCFAIGRVCPRCKTFKPLDRFYIYNGFESCGTRYCKDGCNRAFIREGMYGLKPGTAEKLPTSCAICGATESPGRKTCTPR